MPGICVFPSKSTKLEDASEDQVCESFLCSKLRFIPSCDHKGFSKWRKYAIWQIFFLRLRCLSGWQHGSALQSSLPAPIPVAGSPALLRLLAAHSPCREPRAAGTDTPVTANTSNPLSNKAWLQRTCYSIILCGLLVWNARLPQIRNLLPHGICFILFL